MAEYNIIAGLITNNNDWIIDKVIKTLETYCFKIVIIDNNSTDNTANICKSYKKTVDFNTIKNNNLSITDLKQKLIDTISAYNPDYVIFLEPEEILSANIKHFFDNIDYTINLWKLPVFYLWEDEQFYRIDKYRNSKGVKINLNPYNGGKNKGVIMKFDKNFDKVWKYKYNKENDLHPYNIPRPHSKTIDIGILNYTKLNPNVYENECKIIEDALYSYKCNVKNSSNPLTIDNLDLKEIKDEWLWNFAENNTVVLNNNNNLQLQDMILNFDNIKLNNNINDNNILTIDN